MPRRVRSFASGGIRGPLRRDSGLGRSTPIGRRTLPPERERSDDPPFPGCFAGFGVRALVRSAVAFLTLRDAAQRAYGGFLELVAPSWCRTCDALLCGGDVLCPPCLARVAWISGPCSRCGLPVRTAGAGPIPPRAVRGPAPAGVAPVADWASGPAGGGGCGACAAERWAHDRVVAAGEYSGPLRDLVLLHKFQGDPGAGRFLVEALLAASVRLDVPSAPAPPVVAPVPSHPLKRLVRGRDPCAELADGLARRSGWQRLHTLAKRRWTPPQVALSRSARRRNLREAFRLRGRRRPPEYVVLVDDVVTTGTTASECARALKAAGTSRVDVLAVARSLA